MAHVLLTGRYPCNLTGDRSDDIEAHELLLRIRSGRPWDGARDRRELTPLAQNFLQQLLMVDEEKQLSLDEAMHTLSFYITTRPKSNAHASRPSWDE